jgi:hypothetical protein
MNETVSQGLGAGVMGVFFGGVGGLVLYFIRDREFHFRRHEMDLLMRNDGKEVTIPLDRVMNAVIEGGSDGDGDPAYILRVNLRDPDEQVTLDLTQPTEHGKRSLLPFADAINRFLRRLRKQRKE